MRKYTVLFDIGNTHSKIGFATKSALESAYALPTDRRSTSDALGIALQGLLRHVGISSKEIEACVGSSVVPAISSMVREACARFWGQTFLLAPEDLPVPLENRYANPAEVGSDRLVGAYAARCLMPEPRSIISVDYGTATTFDCVTENTYLGGLICPGIFSSLEALAGRTAKLPHIALSVDEDSPVVGRSTVLSINHGFIFGFAAMTEGLCRRLADTLEGPVGTIATGGFAGSLARVAPYFDSVRPDLLLEGLRLLYYK